MNIKDIALKVAEAQGLRLDHACGCRTCRERDDSPKLIAYAQALVAEIQRQSEPFCYLYKDHDGSYRQAHDLQFKEAHTPVFTFPPSIEALEDKVAEAIVRMCNHNLEHRVVDLIENGEWRKFRKGE